MDQIIDTIKSPWRAPLDGSLTEPPRNFTAPEDMIDCKRLLEETRKAIRPDQRKLYAAKQYSVLLIFQALDAAGKDGAIREVFEDLDPVNVQVSAFKRPTERELRHDFLWRTARRLPERGDIGLFNRSYYEEVLTVRVHPEFLNAQYAGSPPAPETLWPVRYQAIREHERHLAAANTLILKFWLNVSPEKQAERFLERLDNPAKRWKFSMGDIKESLFRDQYDEAVMHMLNETSRPWAPWFCIPADDRWYLRWQIADIVGQAMAALPLEYPEAEEIPAEKAEEVRSLLESRIGD
ncbi:MAG: polyphosphate kinase 2 family protein [Xanthomonadales bacterium]|nr:polyphosphate kinase 2 family protein [Gammaproteobacteria bacterium]MBT8052718.1 polyphosphate kinase 2 family protein [Gammaproteobacteria bacterium]NND57380.1 polyphosphate kinase 2 family protein [Xanthomonadales bacterium]NNK50624.1 polyphosphate kinase 2 family protein [Xanthomonadales bacterium]